MADRRIFCAAILILVLATPLLAQEPGGVAPPPATASVGNQGKGIEISGALSESTIPKGQEVTFLVSVTNYTSKPIFSIHLDTLFKEGLTVVSTSWCDINKIQNAGSVANTQALGCDAIAKKLEAGQSVTVSGQLTARQAHERERVIAGVSWSDGKTSSQSFALLGEIVIQTGWEQWRSSWVYDLLKDLTLPLVLVALGTALGFYDKYRENQRHRLQEQLEESRKKDAELRAQTAQTWTSMLPESHKLATTYYMPVDAAASSALDELMERDEALTKKDLVRQTAAEDRAFYYLLLMSRRFRALADERGGWYFKNRVGEQLVARCLENFRLLFLRVPAQAQVQWSNAVSLIGINEKLGAFQARVAGTEPEALVLQAALGNFRVWLTSPDYDLAVRNLRGMRILLSFEMNRPYEYWYGGAEVLALDGELKKEIEATVKRVAEKQGNFPAIPIKAVEEYLREASA